MIVVFGGSFDPVHLGHIRLMKALLAYPETSEVRLVPCAENPDKPPLCAPAEERLAMLRLLEEDGVQIDTRELERGGVSYTIDTLLSLREEVGAQTSLAFAIGTDVLQTIEEWNDAERLAELMHLIVFRRQGSAYHSPKLWQECADMQTLATRAAGSCLALQNEIVDISSTTIRALLAKQEQPRYLLPGAVWNYIRRKQLYGWEGE